MLAAQGGANFIYGAGMIELGMAFDFAQLLIDAEIDRMILHAINGFQINDEEMSLDAIKEVGLGEFVSNPHTRNNFQQVQSHATLIDRQSRSAWLLSGAKDMTERAYEAAINILENYKPVPLPEDQKAYIRKTIEDAEKELGCYNQSQLK